MRYERETQSQPLEKETLGHRIEGKVAEFVKVVFDCVEDVKRTERRDKNDTKGVDLVIVFEDGSKMVVDVTANDGPTVNAKMRSMKRSLMTAVDNELIPRGIIRVYSETWDSYNSEKVGDEVILHINENDEIKEKIDILKQLIRQIDNFSGLRENRDYKKATESIKLMLENELRAVVGDSKKAA